MKQTVWISLKADEAQPAWVRTDEPTLAEKQAAVGGLIEYVPLHSAQLMPFPLNGEVFMGQVADVIVHEEGLLCAEPKLNVLGSLAAFGTIDPTTGRYLVGDVIVVLTYDDDDETLTVEQVHEWRNSRLPESAQEPQQPVEPTVAVVRYIKGFVPVAAPEWRTPDFGADGDEPDEDAYADWHETSVDSLAEACQFWHALILSGGVCVDPTKGLLTEQGFSAYAHMTHADAAALNRLNTEAVAHMEAQGLDAWTACATFVMAAELSLHLQAQREAGHISPEHWPHEAVRNINALCEGGELPIQPLTINPENLPHARAHFVLDRIGEWCSARHENLGEASATLINATLLPAGWSEWIDSAAALLGGHSGQEHGDPDDIFQRMVDDHHMSTDDPDADDNDDDPFSGVGA